MAGAGMGAVGGADELVPADCVLPVVVEVDDCVESVVVVEELGVGDGDGVVL